MRAAALGAALLLLAGCAFGGDDAPSDGPRRDLAASPESLPPLAPVVTSPTGGATLGPGRPGASSGASAGASASVRPGGPGATFRPGRSASPTGAGATLRPGAAYRAVGTAADGTGDTEGSGPAYADLVGVTVEDDGTNARVTITFAGDVPSRLPAGETMGTGVDLYRSPTQVESDYQLFADGQPDGWFAYLQTPKGFVRYPGRFGIGGRRIEFVVPWSALGSPSSGAFSAFADWTRDATPANAFSEDHAPNVGNARFTR